VVRARRGRDALADLLQLCARSPARLGKPFELASDPPGRYAEPKIASAPFEDEGLADSDAGRYAKSA